MCFGGPSIPNSPPPPPPPPSTVLQPQDPSVLARQDAERKRRIAAGGFASTVLTGSQGITTVATQGKSLLGG